MLSGSVQKIGAGLKVCLARCVRLPATEENTEPLMVEATHSSTTTQTENIKHFEEASGERVHCHHAFRMDSSKSSRTT
jgi:dTDP-4-amino-4,6-dideoxygalactose transaminase